MYNFIIAFRLLFTIYIGFVVYASFYISASAKRSKEKYQTFLSTSKGRFYLAFSLPRNWNRLTQIKAGESEQWRAIQGVRFYNLLIVILVHTVISFTMGPIANTKNSESVGIWLFNKHDY